MSVRITAERMTVVTVIAAVMIAVGVMAAGMVVLAVLAVGVPVAVEMTSGLMAVDRSDGYGVMGEVLIAVVTLVRQGDWEHWPHRQRDGPTSGFGTLVSEIKGLSRPYNVRLTGRRTGNGCHEMAR